MLKKSMCIKAGLCLLGLFFVTSSHAGGYISIHHGFGSSYGYESNSRVEANRGYLSSRFDHRCRHKHRHHSGHKYRHHKRLGHYYRHHGSRYYDDSYSRSRFSIRYRNGGSRIHYSTRWRDH
ncbi:hypothetical protein [Motiliproteus sp. MSK22-1]|uniref:hypothetical protein n=1 Tax=Motiliproteus sp. MSK22-1 TaxID=1897630 RepID=UPI00117FA2A8|nr:hypothetical protein [Motiliproteus sp. MSK22-1]